MRSAWISRSVLACQMCCPDAGGRSSEKVNEEFFKQAGGGMAPLAAQCAHAQMRARITGNKVAAAKLLSACKLGKISHTFQDCVAAFEWLREEPAASSAADAFFAQAQAAYPWSSVFSGRKRLPLPEEELCRRIQAVSVEDTHAE